MDITKSTNLIDFFSKGFSIVTPGDVSARVEKIKTMYSGEEIEMEEQARAEKIEQQLQEYRKKFVEGPRLEIPLQRMNISFEYLNITSLGGYGTVYPVIRITDVWGILDVRKGALLSAQWNKVTVTVPTSTICTC